MSYKYYKVDPNKIRFRDERNEPSREPETNQLKRAGQFAAGLGTALVEGVPGVLGFPGVIQEATVGELPDGWNILSDINQRISLPAQQAIRRKATEYFGDVEPENAATRILQGVAHGIGGSAGIGGVLGASRAALAEAGAQGILKGAVKGAVKGSGVGALSQGVKELPAAAQAVKSSGGLWKGIQETGRQTAKNPFLRDVATVGAMEGTYGLTENPALAAAAGIGTGIGLGMAGSRKPSQAIVDTGKEYEQVLHDKLKSEGSQIKIDGEPLVHQMEKIKANVNEMDIGHGFPEADKSASIKNIDNALNKIRDTRTKEQYRTKKAQLDHNAKKISSNENKFKELSHKLTRDTEKILDETKRNAEIAKNKAKSKYEYDYAKLVESNKNKIKKNEDLYNLLKKKDGIQGNRIIQKNKDLANQLRRELSSLNKLHAMNIKDIDKNATAKSKAAYNSNQVKINALRNQIDIQNKPFQEKIVQINKEGVGKPRPFNAYDLYNLKKNINSVWNTEKSTLNNVQKQRFKSVMGEIDKLEQSNPNIHRYMKTADAIHAASKFESNISKFLESIQKPISDFVPNENAQAGLMALLSVFKGGIKGALKIFAGTKFGQSVKRVFNDRDVQERGRRILQILQKEPKGNKIIEELVKSVDDYAIHKSNITEQAVIGALGKLNAFVDKMDEGQNSNASVQYMRVDPSKIRFRN